MPLFRLTDELVFPPSDLAEEDGLLAIGGWAKILNGLGYQNELPDDSVGLRVFQIVLQLLELRGSEHGDGCLV